MLVSARYGVKLRKKLAEVRKKQKQAFLCPKCGKKKVRRIDFALWKCRACGVLFAGGAFEPFTSAGSAVKKALVEQP